MMKDEIPEELGEFTDAEGKKHVLRRGRLRHESLEPGQLQRIARIRDALIDVDDMTLDGWVDGFMREVDPERQIQVVEACAAVFQKLTEQVTLQQPQMKVLYGFLCGYSGGVDVSALAAFLPFGEELPSRREVIKMYRDARQNRSRP